MGSTITTGRVAAAIETKQGRKLFVLFEETYSSNVFSENSGLVLRRSRLPARDDAAHLRHGLELRRGDAPEPLGPADSRGLHYDLAKGIDQSRLSCTTPTCACEVGNGLD